MKKIITLLCAIAPMLMNAQTLNFSDLPGVGLYWIVGTDSTYTQAIPPGGTSQNWDYSTMQNLDNDTLGFIDATTTPYASSFPTSNLSGYDINSATYSYYTSNSNGLYIDGIANAGTLFRYDVNELYYPVPFSYGDTRNSYSRIQIDSVVGGNNGRIVIRTNVNFSADGSGDLILPSGTYTNVLRIREVATTYDSISVDIGAGIYVPISNSASQITRFSYVKPGSTVALILGIEADSLGQFATNSSYFTGAFINSVPTVNRNNSIRSYPNPASADLNFDLSNISDVTSIVIYDNTGKVIRSMSKVSSFSISDLQNGNYHYVVKGKNGEYSGSFQVQH